MDTQIKKAYECVNECASLIMRGELVVFPTETVYGLGANAFDENAVAKIFKAKGRPQDNPLIVHISSLDEVKDIAVDVPEVFYELARKFMPGPLTVILKKSDKIPYAVTAGGETVGVRMPANEYARALIAASRPLAAPSANRSKHVSPTTAMHVYEDLHGEVPIIMDGGPCKVGIESTVLDLTSDCPVILRPGAITADMLLDIVGNVGVNGKVIKIAKAPGMKYTHYAPTVETVCAASIDSAVAAYDSAEEKGLKPVIVARDIYRDKVVDRYQISLGVTVEDYSRNIYNALRTAEKEYDYIIVEALRGDGLEKSIMNRVEKAASNRYIP
ncbi:MAG: L-threonylcarbamoyladenylate synthase [Bacteroides sp.]|nr:L-threonylcarbamoyladenylate synthase [Bacillota bacterium]MCM1393649.1 L-threonylcarbamoyladenylate synthase [[Eubacterium] siraeum]MCM1455601.1 L-threonylcarbamoyladenylate synthase [Bacteroides sp.]